MEQNQFDEITHNFGKTLTLDSERQIEQQQDDDDDDDDEDVVSNNGGNDEFEFFTGTGDPTSSPVSADDIFLNGQIRPTFPFLDNEVTSSSYDGPPVRKVYVVSPSSESDDVAEGPYCTWTSPENRKTVPAPEMSRKSNSTGFSKLWRVKDLLLVRSHSDGKDAFVFLNGKNDNTTSYKEEEKDKKKKKDETVSCKGKGKKKEKKGEGSVYGELYGKREKDKGKKGKASYLPYRQDLVGFFTNASSMSRNVHPY